MAQTKVSLIKDQVIDLSHFKPEHGITTDHIGEGSTRQYFTESRVQNILTTNNYIKTSDVANLETVTSLSINANVLSYTNEAGVTTNIDLSVYLDDTNLARIVSGSLNSGTGVATFTRDDSSTFTVDFSAFLSDANDYVTSASFNTTSGVLTLTRLGGGTVTVDLDGKYSVLGHTHSWTEITDKPTTFAPSAHNHDDRYYTEVESDSRFINASGDTMTGTLTLSSISGDGMVENVYGNYLHLGGWAVGRTDATAVLVNTAYRADYADSLFNMNISRFTNDSGYITSSGSAAYATSSTRLYASDAPYTIDGAAPYYMYMNYDGAYWELKVSPATPGTVRVAYSNNSNQLSGYSLSGTSSVSDKIFNNKGNIHTTFTDFNTVMNAGANYLQQGTNGPTGTASDQWYGFMLGLGSDYGTSTGNGGSYASQLYWGRQNQGGNPYLWARDLEGGTWGSWRKMSAGNSDTLNGFSRAQNGSNVVLETASNGYLYINNWIHPNNGAGLFYDSGPHFYESGATMYSSHTLRSGDSLRAPIFYDENDTGYYVDLNADLSVKVYGEISNSNFNPGNMQPGALNIGRIDTNYNFLSGSWAGDIRVGILANCLDEWEFALHDSGTSVESILFYQNSTGHITMGRDIGWGTTPIVASNSFRAPIFYDSNDTSYYIDANNTSSLKNLHVPNASAGYSILTGAYDLNRVLIEDGRHGIVVNSDLYPYISLNPTSSANSNPTHGAVVSLVGKLGSGFRRWGMGIAQYNPNELSFGYYDNSQNPHLGVGINWTYPAQMWIDTGGNLFSIGSMRSPIFYDSNDTGRYLNPSGFSNTGFLRVVGDWNNSGVHNEQLTVRGSYASICQRSTVGGQAYVLHHNDDQWTLYVGRGGADGTDWNWAMRAKPKQDGNYVEFRTSARSPIFYDSNDTTYYVDPASGSYLNGANSINVAPESGVGLKIQGGSNGNLGLKILGGSYSSSMSIETPTYGSGISFKHTGSFNANFASFTYGSNNVGSITVTGISTAYNTSSDYRLKENVVPMINALERVSLLKPSRFNFIGDDKTVDGFIAHETQEVVPEAVTGEKDAIGWDGNPEYQGIDQSKLVPLLTAALQEAVAKIESLESRIQALEAQ